MTFTLIEGKEKGDESPERLYDEVIVREVSEQELEDYFNKNPNSILKRVFGSFDNYLNYMTERPLR
jgi:hypothetical protein